MTAMQWTPFPEWCAYRDLSGKAAETNDSSLESGIWTAAPPDPHQVRGRRARVRTSKKQRMADTTRVRPKSAFGAEFTSDTGVPAVHIPHGFDHLTEVQLDRASTMSHDAIATSCGIPDGIEGAVRRVEIALPEPLEPFALIDLDLMENQDLTSLSSPPSWYR